MSMLAHKFHIITEQGVGELGHGREVADSLNVTNKITQPILMKKVQLPGSKGYDTQIDMNTLTQKYDNSLAREFPKHLSDCEYKCQLQKFHENDDAEHTSVNMSFDTSQFTAFLLRGLHAKPMEYGVLSSMLR